MSTIRSLSLGAAVLLVAALEGCDPDGLRPPPKQSAAEDSGSGDAGPGVSEDPATALLPARIRRLSNAEYDASVARLLGDVERVAARFAPDARQAGFTVNDSQRVDPVLAKQLFAAAETLAAEARPRLESLAPCSTPSAAETCARAFIDSFGARAYRRPLVDEETSGLLDVYRVGAQGATYLDGIELVVRALLQSAGFLYLTELGDGTATAEGEVALTPYELASSLSYLVTGGPPDDALLDAAVSGRLDTADGRVAELMRLRRDTASSERLVRIVREWLELDKIETTAKDSTVYPLYDSIKESIAAESVGFVEAVLDPEQRASRGTDDVGALFGADWTISAPGLAELYQGSMSGSGRLTLPARRGVLNQAAFLSIKAHAHESTPVLRGVLIARRLACLSVPSPSTLNIDVVPPVPDPTQTTRERFAVHTSDPGCAQCHKTIDGFGNAFEQFDGMGQHRTTENGRRVDSSTVIEVGADFDGSYADSNTLSEALARSSAVRECFARFMFRAVAARSDASVRAAEERFVGEWQHLPEGERGNVIDTLVAFVNSPLFSHRRAP